MSRGAIYCGKQNFTAKLSGTFYYVSKNISPQERNGCAKDNQSINQSINQSKHNLLLKHVGHIKTSVVRYENKVKY